MLKNAIWLFIISIVVLFIFLPSYSTMQDMREKNVEYQQQIRLLTEKNAKLEEEKSLLEQDPDYLERVGREKMRLIKEGEVIYKITPAEGQ